MKLRATLQIDYEVNLDSYSFNLDGIQTEQILDFERTLFAHRVRDACEASPFTRPDSFNQIIKVEEIK